MDDVGLRVRVDSRNAIYVCGTTALAAGGNSIDNTFPTEPRQNTLQTGMSGKVSHFADRFMGGSHDVKLGVQYSGGGRDAVTGMNDYAYIVAGKRTYGYTRLPWHSGGLIRSIGTYADDTYRLGEALTLNLGLRYDHSKALYPSFPVLDASGNATGKSSASNDDVSSPTG